MNSNGADRVADADGEGTRYSAAAVRESIEWAAALVSGSAPRFGSALWSARHYGSDAVVAALDGRVADAGMFAEWAAHYARRAVPGLR